LATEGVWAGVWLWFDTRRQKPRPAQKVALGAEVQARRESQ
jgi:hypothetical protein